MKVTMLLADAAQAVDGKLYILGGGWSITGPDPISMAIALKIDVPWIEANNRHSLRLALLDEDERAVMLSTAAGEQAVEILSTFEVGRPAGVRTGTPLDLALAITLPALPLRPDSRYVWRCFIDDITQDDWHVSFSTRPLPPTPHPGV